MGENDPFCSQRWTLSSNLLLDPVQIYEITPWQGVDVVRSFSHMKIREMMTKGTVSVSSDTPVIEAAGLMRLHDIGVVPVLDGMRVVGMLTDRDIVLQVVANGTDPKTTPVRTVMSTGSISVFDDQSVEEAVDLMKKYQIRRLPVLDRTNKLVGIVSLGDIAVDVHAGLSGKVLKEVSEPAAPLM